MVGDALRRQPEFVERSATTTRSRTRQPREELVDERSATLGGGADADERRGGLRRFKRRELLRIARPRPARRSRPRRDDRARAHRARRGAASRPRSSVARAAAAVRRDRAWAASAARELSYASDLDVLFVYDGDRRRRLRRGRTRRRAARSPRSASVTPRGPDVPRSTPAPARGRQGPARPLARRLRSVLRALGARRGSARRWSRRAPSPATPSSASGSATLVDAVRVPATVHRRRRPRGAPHEGAHRARAHPARRGSAVPPQARARLALRRRVHACSCCSSSTARAIPSCACPATIGALHRPARGGLLDAGDADALEAAYRFCERARNALYLHTGRRPTRSRPTGAEAGGWPGCSATCTSPRRVCATTTAGSPAGRAGSSSACSTDGREPGSAGCAGDQGIDDPGTERAVSAPASRGPPPSSSTGSSPPRRCTRRSQPGATRRRRIRGASPSTSPRSCSSCRRSTSTGSRQPGCSRTRTPRRRRVQQGRGSSDRCRRRDGRWRCRWPPPR